MRIAAPLMSQPFLRRLPNAVVLWPAVNRVEVSVSDRVVALVG